MVATGRHGASIAPEQLSERSDSLHFDQPVNIQYTSGTTGFPKGATLSHYNILNNGYMVGESIGLTPRDRLVIPVPLYHCFGMVMGNLGCITHGSTMIYPNDAFDPLLTLQTVAEEKATGLYGVPTMFIAMLDQPQRARIRSVEPAHRDHGRRHVPDRSDAPGHQRDAHERSADCLRHDRNQPGVAANRRRTTSWSCA